VPCVPTAGHPPPPFIDQGEAVISMPHSDMHNGCVLASSGPRGTDVLENPCEFSRVE
jgi:hypothetical protein